MTHTRSASHCDPARQSPPREPGGGVVGEVVGDVEVEGIAVTLPGGEGVAPSPLGPGAGLCPASPPDGGAGLGASLHAKRAMKSTLMEHLDMRRAYHGRREPTDVEAERAVVLGMWEATSHDRDAAPYEGIRWGSMA